MFLRCLVICVCNLNIKAAGPSNGIRNIMEDQYALKPAHWQTSLFRLQIVKLMMTTYNNILMLETSR